MKKIIASVLIIALIIAIAIGYKATRNNTSAEIPESALSANNQGIAYLEQYETIQANGKSGFENASEQFAIAMKESPRTMAFQVNYGMSLFFTGKEDKIDEAIRVFQQILKIEPDNTHSQFCLGIIHYYRSDAATAYPYFKRVTELVPNDAYAWYFRGMAISDREDSPEAKECFDQAVALDPYLTSARHSVDGHRLTDNPAVREGLQKENLALRAAFWERTADTKPTKMGKLGTPIVVGSPATSAIATGFQGVSWTDGEVTLASGTTWASELPPAMADLRKKFGAAMIRLDFNADGRPDLLLLSAVTRKSQTGDLLLENLGAGKFRDVTTEWGLLGEGSVAAAVADFDNSGHSDLLLTRLDGVRLLRNQAGKRFEDVTASTPLAALKGVFLSAAWVDLDQDGDVDLVLGQYANAATSLHVFLNVGEAPPTPRNQPPLPLSVKFQRFEHKSFEGISPVTGLVASDLDGDGDMDLLVLSESAQPVVLLNDRLLRFHRGSPLMEDCQAISGLTVDLNRDSQSDLVLLRRDKSPLILASTNDDVSTDTKNRFRSVPFECPSLLQLQAIDIDHDGWLDLIGLSETRRPVHLHGDGKLTLLENSLDSAVSGLTDLTAMAVCDVNGDCFNDLLLWSASKGLVVKQYNNNANNLNRAVRVQLSGRRDPETARTNNDGIGAKVTVLAGRTRMFIENTSLDAGLGHSRLPLDFGIGKAQVVQMRIQWPDVVPQSEVDVASCEIRKIAETERRSSSCPVLFTWDGQKFRYVTDILGAGSVGELSADGSTRPPRPEESLKIEAGQLAIKDKKYIIKIAEPMDEVMYLDRVMLEAVDHPDSVQILPDERFAVADPQPTQQILAFSRRFSPMAAIDHRGQDQLARLQKRDGITVDGFQRRLWHGFAEEHSLMLDFGSQLATLGDRPLHLILAGWTDYAFPETIFAAEQAGVPMQTPVLEQRDASGNWRKVAEIGFPAGLPRVMTTPIRLLPTPQCQLRIRTNMCIYWDQIEIGVTDASPLRMHTLPITTANLARRGFARELVPNRKPPAIYDDSQHESVSITRWQGKVTRLGDVTELLQETDDRFVIGGPGDEVEIAFDASKLPPVPAHHTRSFVLRSNGFCKDAAAFTSTGGQVGPLPFRGMTSYPAGAIDRKFAPKAQEAYDRQWNTRSVR